MVFVVGTNVQLDFATSDTGDDAGLADATTCMGDASCSVSCQEVKVDEKQIKFEKDTVAANMSSVTHRWCVQSIMTAGDNNIYAYTDGNSVTTNDVVTLGSNLSAGDNDFTITQNLLDEILTTNYTVRFTSDGTSKNKMGESSIEYTVPLIDIDGITKDDDDNVVTSRGVVLLRRTGGASPYDWVQVQSLTSNGTTGVFQFSYEDDSSEYRCFAQNSDGTKSDITPEVQGV